jgi:threonine/homoserine/homoserine lactone efflux protein
VLLLVLGVLALLAAARQWRGRPRAGEEAAAPGWMRTIDDLTIVKAGGLGFALTALNPKNVLLTVAAGAEIAELALPPSRQVAGAVVFVLVASVGVMAPLVLSLVLGERAQEPLEAIRHWMIRHSVTIMSVLFLLIGAKLIGDAISGFAG